MSPAYTEYCVCPACRSGLVARERMLLCVQCSAEYPIRNGIPILLPNYSSREQLAYERCYRSIAEDDLRAPIEPQRESRHSMLMRFIGDVKGKRVLDIGSSHALYLQKVQADLKVAVDIAVPYLEATSENDGIVKICGDAEYLPFKAGYFDVIIIADILEHLLNPGRLVEILRTTCCPDTRIIVHVPWEEELASYQRAKYEFTHLRSFTSYRFAELWRGFHVTRKRETAPCMEEPIVFALERWLPLWLFNILVHAYYETALCKWDYETRIRWINDLPKREWWLLCFYKPKFRIYELQLSRGTLWAALFWQAQKLGRRILAHVAGISTTA